MVGGLCCEQQVVTTCICALFIKVTTDSTAHNYNSLQRVETRGQGLRDLCMIFDILRDGTRRSPWRREKALDVLGERSCRQLKVEIRIGDVS